MDDRVYITYHPSGLPLNGTVFSITACLLYRLLSNAIQQKPDQHIFPPIVEITPTEGEEGEGEKGGKEGSIEGKEEEEQFKLKKG